MKAVHIIALATAFHLAIVSAGAAEPVLGFVPVIGSGYPGHVHDDRGPHPVVLGAVMASSGRVEVINGAYDGFDVPGVIRIAYIAGTPDPADIEDFNDDGIFHFIYENEPEGAGNVNWPTEYMDRLKIAYPIIHGVNDDNVVIAGNLFTNDFARLYVRGFKDNSDLAGFHNYSDDPATGINMGAAVSVHNTMVAYGDGDKQIFLGEGWGPKRELSSQKRLAPDAEMTPTELTQLRDFIVNGYWNIVTSTPSYDPAWINGVLFFTFNDNWGGWYWAERAVPHYDEHGHIIYYTVDGYNVGLDIYPHFYNGGVTDIYGNSKDNLMDVFPGDGLSVGNSGFEYYDRTAGADVAGDWEGRGGAPAGSYAIDNSIRHGGRRSQRVSIVSAGSEYVTQTTVKNSVSAGATYTASAWVRTWGVAGTGAQLALRFADEDGTPIGGTSYSGALVGGQAWTRVDVTATAPASASRAIITCQLTAGSGRCWFDDVSIVADTSVLPAAFDGYVMDIEHSPVVGATVATLSGGYSAVTNGSGYFQMTALTPGVYDVQASAAWHAPMTVRAQVAESGATNTLGFDLDIVRQTLPTAVRTYDPGIGGTLLVSWTPPDDTVDYYRVYRSTVPKELGDLVHDNVTDTFVWDEGLLDGTRYSYTIHSVIGGQESDNDDQRPGVSTSGAQFTMYSVGGSASWSPGYWADQYGQTFVATRSGSLAGASCTPGYGGGGGGTFTFSLRQGGINGTQVGPSRTLEIAGDGAGTAHWNGGEVPITAGQTYCLRINSTTDFGCYRDVDVYPDGNMYVWSSSVPDRDIWSTITGVEFQSVLITDVAADLGPAGDATVTWTTNATAGTQVDYGPTESYGYTTALDPTLVCEHSAVVSGVAAGWHFRVRSPRSPLPEAVSLDYVMELPAESVGALASGWNLIGVPLIPADPAAASVFADAVAAGNTLDNALFSYAPGAGYSIYPGDFSAVDNGAGYWLYIDTPCDNSVAGFDNPGDAAIALGSGWNLIAQPHDGDTAWGDCTISDGVTAYALSDPAAETLVQRAAYAYGSGGYDLIHPDPGSGDDHELHGWRGYWVLAKQAGLTLSVPTP